MVSDQTGTSAGSVCAIVPAFKVKAHIAGVLSELQSFVDHIIVVDDHCPEGSGREVEARFPNNPNISVIYLPENQGVGGAVVEGYKAAVEKNYQVLVKVDGDGQMDPGNIPYLVEPISAGEADYTKGNRFFDVDGLRAMPVSRLVGNAGLSFLTKLSTGYWQIMDPTNGFTAINAAVLPWVKLEQVDKRYFFESDMLFRLGLVNAVIQDVPMPARYGDEVSNLSVGKSLFSFGGKHLARIFKRIFYQYFLRGFSLASLYLVFGLLLMLFALIFGIQEWRLSNQTGIPATPGSIMLAALPAFIGFQMLLNFFGYDMVANTSKPLSRRMPNSRK
jgi:dolichol-phosphate mannosyltransferase